MKAGLKESLLFINRLKNRRNEGQWGPQSPH